MKKLWSHNSRDISEEIQALIVNKSQLVLINNAGQPKKTKAIGMAHTKSGNLLVVDYPAPMKNLNQRCLCYYHKRNHPIMGFYCRPAKQVDEYLGINLPEAIFEIQRRKFPRVLSPNQSVASFSIQNRNRVIHGTVENVCMNGAKISGDFPMLIQKDNTVMPISLSLFQRFKHNQETPIHIPEAKVARAEGSQGKTNHLGICFNLPKSIQPLMEDYVEHRNQEESF